MTIDLSYRNLDLYRGCVSNGDLRASCKTLVQNLEGILAGSTDREELNLVGPMVVWAYCPVLCCVVPLFERVYYHSDYGPTLVTGSGLIRRCCIDRNKLVAW